MQNIIRDAGSIRVCYFSFKNIYVLIEFLIKVIKLNIEEEIKIVIRIISHK